ncbi:MAG TPA: protein translocase subunit SecF [Gemmatimonadetes bacterium]|nr:protein translocase subunit SecF [Gemmatimonadota bacterium]
MRLFEKANYSFIEKTSAAIIFSLLLIVAGVVSMIINVQSIGSWQNYGVDFSGGSLIQVRFEDAVSAAEMRSALGGAEAPPITRFGEDNEFVVRAGLDGEEMEIVRQRIEQQLSAAFQQSSFSIVRTETVGPKIGAELQSKAGLAILFSFILTLIYIAIRFQFRFGLAAIIATIHDIMITLGFLALFRIEIALPTVAAILTIVGYSLNDTIVVFDRIRENLKSRGGRRQDPVALINQSINETLPRTILTSGTTLVVLLALLVVGGVVIRDFTMVLIVGVVVGTYSSIFIASPALLKIQRTFDDREQLSSGKKKRTRSVSVSAGV